MKRPGPVTTRLQPATHFFAAFLTDCMAGDRFERARPAAAWASGKSKTTARAAPIIRFL
jgi:hypothetical protein